MGTGFDWAIFTVILVAFITYILNSRENRKIERVKIKLEKSRIIYETKLERYDKVVDLLEKMALVTDGIERTLKYDFHSDEEIHKDITNLL